MKRKLILILLAAALLCGAFAVVALVADDNPADAAKPDEKKKLSEFTDEELEEYLSTQNYDFERQTWEFTRRVIYVLEEDIDHVGAYGNPALYETLEELRAVVADYYGIECEHAYPLMYESYFNTMQEEFGDEVEK